MSVTMMLVMLALLAMLGLIEIGYLFWAKRDAQKVADLAALAGAQRLELCSADNSDNSAARQSALTQNRFAGTLQIRCGNWSASRSTGNRFVTTVDASNPRNAVQVIAERSVLPFFGQNTSLPTVSVGGGPPLRAHGGVRGRFAAAAHQWRLGTAVDPAPGRPGCHQCHRAVL
jgi:uncharacterized membrane protein